MNLVDCYRLLGLPRQANLEQIKASYRRLARQYHPDINPDQWAQEHFIQVTAAYKALLNVVPQTPPPAVSPGPPSGIKISVQSPAANYEQSASSDSPPAPVSGTTPPPEPEAPEPESSEAPVIPDPEPPPLSALEQQLKQTSYLQLHDLLKHDKFPRATALVEALAVRLPHDPEVRQWQAITYQRWGRSLIKQKQVEKARIYLKKSLRTDPHNRALWAEVEEDFRRLEKLF